MIEGFSAPFQKALQQTLLQKEAESPPSLPSARNYSTRKTSAETSSGGTEHKVSFDETTSSLGVISATTSGYGHRRPAPPTSTQEAAALKCARWLEREVRPRSVSPRIAATWKREKNIIVASQRVSSPIHHSTAHP